MLTTDSFNVALKKDETYKSLSGDMYSSAGKVSVLSQRLDGFELDVYKKTDLSGIITETNGQLTLSDSMFQTKISAYKIDGKTISQIKQTADRIDLVIQDNSSSPTGFSLTSGMASLVAAEINLDGVVKFTNSGGKNYYPAGLGTNITEIDGGKINAYSITADKIKAGEITADMITTGTFNADLIKTGRLSAVEIDINKATYSNGTISNNIITCGGDYNSPTVVFGNENRQPYWIKMVASGVYLAASALTIGSDFYGANYDTGVTINGRFMNINLSSGGGRSTYPHLLSI
jgi:hypothetical protein